MRVLFDVEEAGCESCAKLLRQALGAIGSVEQVQIDEAADRASIVLSGDVSRQTVETTLHEASLGAGHAYRIRPGSWFTADGDFGTRPAHV